MNNIGGDEIGKNVVMIVSQFLKCLLQSKKLSNNQLNNGRSRRGRHVVLVKDSGHVIFDGLP